MVLLSFCLALCACSCFPEFHVTEVGSMKKVIMQIPVASVFQLIGILFTLWS